MSRLCPLAFLGLALAVLQAHAQPVVNPGGVLNAGSYTLDWLPNDGIAQGAMFVVFGRQLGPAVLAQAPGLPLPTELAGASVRVTVGGTTVTPFLLYAAGQQLAGVLPSHTPVGQGTLKVTFDAHSRAGCSRAFRRPGQRVL